MAIDNGADGDQEDSNNYVTKRRRPDWAWKDNLKVQ